MKTRTRRDIENRFEVVKMFNDCEGWWVWLKPGYWCSAMECGTIHEDTIRECCDMMQYVERAPTKYVENSGHDWDEVNAIYAEEDSRTC